VANTFRVIHIISSLSHGGAEKLAMELAKLQVAAGLNVSICYLNSAQTLGNDVSIEQEFLRDLNKLGITTIALDEPKRASYWRTRTRNLKRATAEFNAEIIHTHLGRGLMLLLLANIRVPTIMTIHSMYVGFPNILFKFFRSLNVTYVAVSTPIADKFKGLVRNQISIIFNGINAEKFRVRELSHSQLQNHFQFVAVGRVLPPKNYPLLLEALSMLAKNSISMVHPWKMKIAGDGALLEEMRARVKDLNLTDFVEFLGGCDDVPSLLHNSDAFVMSSDYEGMPMAMLEAMSVGLPVVSTNFIGISDVVSNHESALISDVGSAEHLAANMARILSSPDLCQSLASSAQDNAKKFTIQATHQQYLEVYEQRLRINNDKKVEVNRKEKLLIAATVPETVRLLMRGQLDWFAENNYSVEVCTDPGSDYGLGNAEFIDSVAQRHYIPMERDFSIIRDLKALFNWIVLLRKTKPDFLVACTPKASLLALVAGFLSKTPHRVYILFGLRYETAQGMARVILKMTERICSACSHIVIVVSPSLATCATKEHLINPKKIRLIGIGSSNGVDSSRFVPIERSVRAEKRKAIGYSDDDFVVGFVGRLTPDKGIATLLGALRQVTVKVPRVKLLLIGPDEGSKVTEPWAQSVGSQPDTAQWHPLLDVLVLPTKREGFPNVVLEAHACEIPVITTRATGAVDSVVDGENGILVDVDNAEQLVDAIILLATDQELARKMGRDGREWVKENFQPESIWSGMDHLFQSLK